MNQYDLAAKRLKNHANLPDANDEEEPRKESLGYQFYIADRNRIPPDPALVDDVVNCLSVLNNYFNGPDPDNKLGPREQPIADVVSYSVARILTSSLAFHRKWSASNFFPEEVLIGVLAGIHKIAFCWEQVLAGDVRDLLEGFACD